MPGFVAPPPGYGDVGFFWWLGDKLTKERLQWQLDQLAGMGVSGLQINYAHDDHGGRTYGLTFPSDPPLFSEDWWNLFTWFQRAAKEKGMAVSLSDYTLGTAGQGSYIDEVLRKNPEIRGAVLKHQVQDVEGGRRVDLDVPGGVVGVVAYRVESGKPRPGGEDLRGRVSGGKLSWDAPAGKWQVHLVWPETQPLSIDPMHPEIGQKVIADFFQLFEDRSPGESGKSLNFFFSDELQFGVAGRLWNDRFLKTFKERMGYDLAPELPALFTDIGPRTPKIRMDYYDLVVALQEEGYFKPLFDWHQARGMIYGCDHGGRGRQVDEFGDYFRTQRWNQGPGADQPRLAQDLIKAKVAASIAHMYERPRVWLEGFYSSGWGTSGADVAHATFANYAMGFNLLTLHGLYYSTRGGYWEWAPPCNHFHMPYWRHMKPFMDCVQRLSYLMSQGRHVCDVAVMYPVEPSHAGMGGKESVAASFDTARALYGAGIDFDFMDPQSLARATVKDGRLHVSGESFRALVLPAMQAVRFSTLRKAVEFHRAGGLVVVLGPVPVASERAGRDDPELNTLVAELTTRVGSPDAVRELVAKAFPRDYEGPGMINHRRVGGRDVYLIYGAPKGSEARFRATGKVELWNPWTGKAASLPVIAQHKSETRLHLPLGEREPQVIVFSPGAVEVAAAVNIEPPQVVPVEGEWEFELAPALDNRFGDFHWPATPALIGAEVRRLETTSGDPVNGPWRAASCSYGPMMWKLGPLPDNFDEKLLVGLTSIDPSKPVEFGGKRFTWQPYEFSWRWGREGDPGHQGYHGLKGKITDQFICLGAPRQGKNETVYDPEPGGSRYYLWTTVPVEAATVAHPSSGGLKPAAVWVNHKTAAGAVTLAPGFNPVLLRYNRAGRGFFVMDRNAPPPGDPAQDVFSDAAYWIWEAGAVENGDRWFRRSFDLAKRPQRARIRLTCDNGYSVSVNGVVVGRGSEWREVREYDVSTVLRPGKNEVVVKATNTGADAGLIAELVADDLTVSTDKAWQVSESENGSRGASVSLGAWRDGLWYKHEIGPPQLVGGAASDRPNVGPGSIPDFHKPLAMSFWNNPSILPFDAMAGKGTGIEHFRFTSPPGFRGMTLTARGRVTATAGGKAMREVSPGKFEVETPDPRPVPVHLAVHTVPGAHGGAAIPEVIRLDTVAGLMPAGDWSANESLLSYSGGAWYRKTVTLPAAKQVVLDLGIVVSTVELRVNGQSAGVRVAPPWTFDLTTLAKPGENRLELLVYNTLSNHYTSIPTMFRGSTAAGLLGPVTLQVFGVQE